VFWFRHAQKLRLFKRTQVRQDLLRGGMASSYGQSGNRLQRPMAAELLRVIFSLERWWRERDAEGGRFE